MEARLDQIQEELKKISAIAISTGELRSEVRSMFKGLNRRLDEFLRHRGIESTGTWEQQIEDLDLVATKLYLTVDDPDLEMQHSFDFKSVVKSKIRRVASQIEAPHSTPRSTTFKVG
ncbi:hypothetical protein Scep_021601 [Stephania cephalantha]|uniref:Uncharacterized protein n=1 Tax=Stephania cephalantha TaxID=152367 RepID=A0AAP0I0D0_9MAGN